MSKEQEQKRLEAEEINTLASLAVPLAIGPCLCHADLGDIENHRQFAMQIKRKTVNGEEIPTSPAIMQEFLDELKDALEGMQYRVYPHQNRCQLRVVIPESHASQTPMEIAKDLKEACDSVNNKRKKARFQPATYAVGAAECKVTDTGKSNQLQLFIQCKTYGDNKVITLSDEVRMSLLHMINTRLEVQGYDAHFDGQNYLLCTITLPQGKTKAQASQDVADVCDEINRSRGRRGGGNGFSV